jgi:hypothetical protein
MIYRLFLFCIGQYNPKKKQYKCEQNGEPKTFIDLAHQKRTTTL